MGEAFSMDTLNIACLGYDHLAKRFEKAFSSGRMPHAWLLLGPRGVGKKTFAFQMMRYVLAGGVYPLETDPLAIQVAQGSHPGLLSLDQVSMDDLRKLFRLLALSSADKHAWRCCWLGAVDDWPRRHQNALLKTLEDPPQRVLFFLSAASQALVLPTIRSRCQHLSFRPLTVDAFHKALRVLKRQVTPSSADALLPSESVISSEDQALYSRASGLLGQALSLLHEGEDHAYKRLDHILLHGLLPANHPAYQPPFGPHNQDFWAECSWEMLQKDVVLWIQKMLVKAVTGCVEEPLLHKISERFSAEVWCGYLEKFRYTVKEAHIYNLAPFSVATAIFSVP